MMQLEDSVIPIFQQEPFCCLALENYISKIGEIPFPMGRGIDLPR